MKFEQYLKENNIIVEPDIYNEFSRAREFYRRIYNIVLSTTKTRQVGKLRRLVKKTIANKYENPWLAEMKEVGIDVTSDLAVDTVMFAGHYSNFEKKRDDKVKQVRGIYGRYAEVNCTVY